MIKLTEREKEAIHKFKELEKMWPKSLWLYWMMPNKIIIMRYKEDGSYPINEWGRFDDKYQVDKITGINIDSDE